MTDTNDPALAFARALIDDARRDRDVLRERWATPRWRDDVLRIATAIERNPALIPAVEKCIAEQLATTQNESTS
jgi:hypothetical protein